MADERMLADPIEVMARAAQMYDRALRAQVEPDNMGRYIALDADGADYEISDNYGDAADKILERKPDAAVAVLRIGHAVAGRLGGGSKGRAEGGSE